VSKAMALAGFQRAGSGGASKVPQGIGVR
jgi:hypothetical protein